MSVRGRCVAVVLFAALTATACSPSGPAAPSIESTKTTAANPALTVSATRSSGTTNATTIDRTAPLSDKEILWLAAVTRIQAKLNSGLSKVKGGEVTKSSNLAMANALHVCSRELVRIGPSSQRLESVDKLARRACGAYDKAAACSEKAATMSVGPGLGQAAVRKYSEVLDCVTAGIDDGGTLMVKVLGKIIEIKSASGDI
jgi:hypothetical protein